MAAAFHKHPADRIELEKYVKYFIIKAFLVISKSRLATDRIHTRCRRQSQGSEWYHLAIDEIPDVTETVRAYFDKSKMLTGDQINLEISLTTDENETMILEVWNVKFTPSDCKPVKVQFEVYNSLGRMLKSLYILTRAMKAYKVTRGQVTGDFTVHYKIYSGTPDMRNLGENASRATIGESGSPFGTLKLSCDYRTEMVISSNNYEDLCDNMKENYYEAPPPKPHESFHVLTTRNNNRLSPADLTALATSPPPNTFYMPGSPKEKIFKIGVSSSENTDSSGSAGSKSKGSQITPDKTTFRPSCAFVPRRASQASLEEDVPFSMLLELSHHSSVERLPQPDQLDGEMIERSIFDEGEFVEFDEDRPDFVLITPRMPFAGGADGDAELNDFYRRCKDHPELDSFKSGQTISSTIAEYSDLDRFEHELDDFDNLLKQIGLKEETQQFDLEPGSPV